MTTAERLEKCMREGNLSVADLARWFDRPDPTVRGWVAGGGIGGPWLDVAEIEALLRKLENLIKKKRGFPILRMTPRKRIEHLRTIRYGRR